MTDIDDFFSFEAAAPDSSGEGGAATETTVSEEPEPTQAAPAKPIVVDGIQAAVPSLPDEIGILYFDIETIPDYDRIADFESALPEAAPQVPETERSQLDEPENLLKLSVKAFEQECDTFNLSLDYLEELRAAENRKSKPRGSMLDAIGRQFKKKQKAAESGDKRRKAMATCPEMCRIVAIGLAADDGEIHAQVTVSGQFSETDLLNWFWNAAAGTKTLCGFNCEGFDLPAIQFRSMLLGVDVPRVISTARHKAEMIDLMRIRFGHSMPSKGQGLKWLASCFGIERTIDTDMDGSKVEDTFFREPEVILDYVRDDVHLTREVAKRYSGVMI